MTSEVGRRPATGWLIAGAAFGAVTAGGLIAATASMLVPETPGAAGPPHFVEESAGIDHIYDGEFEFFVGGGVAVFDCNDDGRQDLFVAGGVKPAALFVNRSPVGGRLAFARSAEVAIDRVTGAYPLDVDGDGIADLAVLRHGEDMMLRGQGDCRFQVANDRWGVEGDDDWTVAFSATWEDQATMPTLAFGNYLGENGQQTGECADHRFYRAGDDRYQPPRTLTPGWCTLSILFSQWDRSGRADLRMTNDRHYYRHGEEQLWRVEPGAEPRLYRHDEGWQTMQIWGMGIASQDLTGDGYPEVFLTSQGDHKLQTLADAGTGPEFTDSAFARGVTVHRPFTGNQDLPSTGWHAEFQDVNNDTYSDLFVTKGNVEAQADYAMLDPNNLLLGQPDGTFSEAADQAGVLSFARSRGAALADFNLDGWLDLVVVNRRDPVQVWRNQGVVAAPGNWLAIRLTQPGANRDAIGSWVEVTAGNRRTEREVTVGGGHAGGQLGWVHFGLGAATSADVRVIWPDGAESQTIRVDDGQFVTIDRDSAQAIPFQLPED